MQCPGEGLGCRRELTKFSVCLAKLPFRASHKSYSKTRTYRWRDTRAIAYVSTIQGAGDGNRNREVVQSDERVWIHSAAERRQGRIRPHFGCRARRTEFPQ